MLRRVKSTCPLCGDKVWGLQSLIAENGYVWSYMCKACQFRYRPEIEAWRGKNEARDSTI